MIDFLTLGAGRHNENRRQEYSKICKSASRKGALILSKGQSALDAAVEAVSVLEDCALTNAGYGSNLTWEGTVECDASVMDSASRTWGAVGAVSGIKNPCIAAKEVCLGQKKEGTLGRVPPCLLVGQGAKEWAASNGVETVDSIKLINPDCLKKYNKYKKMVQNQEKLNAMDCDFRTDTVGAVCIDKFGRVASVCSSGGIILKHSGRLGQAAVFGAGCWADEGKDKSRPVATCSTGCGEQLIHCTLAQSAATRLSENSSQPRAELLSRSMTEDFLESHFLQEKQEKMGGILALVWSAEEECGELLWAHTTQTMALGYMREGGKPTFKLSTLPAGKTQGQSVAVEGITFSI